jgi:hypothetical protein
VSKIQSLDPRSEASQHHGWRILTKLSRVSIVNILLLQIRNKLKTERRKNFGQFGQLCRYLGLGGVDAQRGCQPQNVHKRLGLGDK